MNYLNYYLSILFHDFKQIFVILYPMSYLFINFLNFDLSVLFHSFKQLFLIKIINFDFINFK